jgi:transposase
VLNLRARSRRSQPCKRQVRDRLFTFYNWCTQNGAVPRLLCARTTISRWEDEIAAAPLAGVTNAISESLNRLAEL